jgi:hypothetical protein
MEFITLVVMALLCLFSETNKIFAFIFFALLFIASPLLFIVLLAITIVIRHFYKSKQRKFYEPPTLPRRD